MTCKKCGHFKPEPNQAYGHTGAICQCKENTEREEWKRKFVVEVDEDLKIENTKLKEKIAYLEGKIEVLEEEVRRWHVAYPHQHRIDFSDLNNYITAKKPKIT